MATLLETAPELGTVGLAILAVILAIFLALKALELYRRNGKTNGIGTGNGNRTAVSRTRLDQLRMICPFGTGRRSLDDVHEILVSINTAIEGMERSQEQLAKDTRDLHIEVARGDR